jgi:hypothetical protein
MKIGFSRVATATLPATALLTAHASLSLSPAQDFSGGGLGAANTVLTLQNIGTS